MIYEEVDYMAQNVRYGKPCMTNLPPELGRQIISEILNTPRPDQSILDAKAKAVKEELRKQLEKRRK